MNRLEEAPAYPVRVIADVTRRCNLSCWYCHSSSGPSYRGPELTGKDIQNIYQAVEEKHVFDISLTGGEPTLWAALADAMEQSKHLIYPAIQMITNATVLDERKLGILRKGNLKRICVSLDGTREVHNTNRGQGVFEKTLAGLSALKELVDDLTVISVLDATSYSKWPELTTKLVEMGISQHHLAPVSFTGGAMENYRGLNREQFTWVRRKVEELKTGLPDNFRIRFNDILVNGPEGDSISLHSFTEGVKGWHVVVRPNGDVNAAVRVWGRDWRDNERLGNIHERSLSDILDEFSIMKCNLVKGKFSNHEEVQRKYHLGASGEVIVADIQDVRSVAAGGKGKKLGEIGGETVSIGEKLLNPKNTPARQAMISSALSNPGRFRIRDEREFGLAFDRNTFDIIVLTSEELVRPK